MKRIKERALLFRPLMVPFILYIGTLVLASNDRLAESGSPLSWILSLLPLLPAGFIAVGTIKAINRFDELERKIVLEAAAFGFMLTFLGMLGLGLLARIGVQIPNPIYLCLFMVAFLTFGKLLGNWRYK